MSMVVRKFISWRGWSIHSTAWWRQIVARDDPLYIPDRQLARLVLTMFDFMPSA
jgi:hypothetical protein